MFHLDIQAPRGGSISWSFFDDICGVWIADETLSRVFDISTQSKQNLRSKRRTKIAKIYTNSPFPSSFVPLFQNESKCEIFQMKMSFACSLSFIQLKVIFIKMASTYTRFESEAQGNSEMAY